MLEFSEASFVSTGSVEGIVNEASNTLITKIRFDGSNYLPWFHSAQLFIIGKR